MSNYIIKHSHLEEDYIYLQRYWRQDEVLSCLHWHEQGHILRLDISNRTKVPVLEFHLPQVVASKNLVWILVGTLSSCLIFFSDFIYSWETQREKQRHRQKKKQAPCRKPSAEISQSQDYGITTWAESRCQTTEPPTHPRLVTTCLSLSCTCVLAFRSPGIYQSFSKFPMVVYLPEFLFKFPVRV